MPTLGAIAGAVSLVTGASGLIQQGDAQGAAQKQMELQNQQQQGLITDQKNAQSQQLKQQSLISQRDVQLQYVREQSAYLGTSTTPTGIGSVGGNPMPYIVGG